MSTPQKRNPEQEPAAVMNAQSEEMQRSGFRVGLALISAAVGSAAKAVVEHFLKNDQ
ncbi:hypothetical protein BN159_p94 (plasmid) [Streptomyces davaonensis JCM 4913]|uniref:Uncharacterized protein n=1 Tax=Streptomyces davaonensis (strain DSM 101723 / JCM 4913 / KCC S-0913 / 768) TaxID=1214101 RepID=K4R9L1_STRDJ|nr:hypothetical protein [Streptomyces davaonensis]CCK32966.1 hypothetical protein BN159_p94 [Streptomyces davaonensis JCM 4913]